MAGLKIKFLEIPVWVTVNLHLAILEYVGEKEN